MKVLKLVAGIFAVLVALYAGGCTMVLVVAMINNLALGSPEPNSLYAAFIGMTAVPFAIASWLAWLCFRKKGREPE